MGVIHITPRGLSPDRACRRDFAFFMVLRVFGGPADALDSVDRNCTCESDATSRTAHPSHSAQRVNAVNPHQYRGAQTRQFGELQAATFAGDVFEAAGGGPFRQDERRSKARRDPRHRPVAQLPECLPDDHACSLAHRP